MEPARLGHDQGLPGVLLGVQDLVGDAPALEHAGEHLGLLHRGRAHQDGLAPLVALDDVLHHRLELGLLALVDEVGPVVADHGLVGGDGHHGEVVGAGELGRLGGGRACHPRQLVVHAEVVLQGDGGPGVVLLLDLDPLLGLHRLVQPVRPAPALQDAAGELVDDLHLAVLDDVVLVPLVQLLGPQRLLELVHVVDGDCVVHVVHAQLAFHLLDAGLGGDDGPLLLVDLVVVVARQVPGDGRELVVEPR